METATVTQNEIVGIMAFLVLFDVLLFWLGVWIGRKWRVKDENKDFDRFFTEIERRNLFDWDGYLSVKKEIARKTGLKLGLDENSRISIRKKETVK
ncbi:MAG: hypothetical protein J6Y62_04600 [Clostridia bacterium]|nr:hypothetical protein [Clostridia bacterium]